MATEKAKAPLTPEQLAYQKAPGKALPTSLDNDGIGAKTFEERSVVRAAGERARRAALALKETQKLKSSARRAAGNKAAKDARKAAREMTAAEKSAATREWKQSVIDSLRGAKAGDAGTYRGSALSAAQAKGFHDAAAALEGTAPGTTDWRAQPLADDDQMGQLLEGKVKGLGQFAGTGSGYNTWKRPMWNYLHRKGLAYDADWQQDTAVSWLENGKKVNADASKELFFVSNGKSVPPGTWALITFPNGKQVFARAYDTNPKLADKQIEMSDAVFNAGGYPVDDPGAAPVGSAKIKIFPGTGGMGGTSSDYHLTPAEMQEGGKYIQAGKAKSIKSRQDLERVREKERAKEEEANKQSGVRLLQGENSVLIGPDLHPIGYADPRSTHEGGGHLVEGSSTVLVGRSQGPASRIDDGTNDGRHVVSGSQTVFIGGATTRC